jgi:membrane protein YqaA with SNARE-associated domain
MFKRNIKKIPILPVSALVFYLLTIILWKLELIPEPKEILGILEGLYTKYGYLGLVIATFLESIVYLGLYFPGSLIIALAVFFSDGSYPELLIISVIVALTLTVTAVINYFLGRYVSVKKFSEKAEFIKESKLISKGLFLSMLHPDFLAFFFFNEGLTNRGFKKVVYVPIIMIPYGFIFALLLSKFSGPARQTLENPSILLAFILLWIMSSFIFSYKRRKVVKEIS